MGIILILFLAYKKEKDTVMRRQGKSVKIAGILFLTCVICILCVFQTKAAEVDMIQNAKNGIVEIYSGYVNDDKEYKIVEHSSGFLIYNQENTAYVLTTYDTLTSNKYEDEAVIKVVVGKDVKEEASIFTYSEKENYAVLELRSSVNEKQALKFGDSSESMVGDTIYALGFPKNEDGKLDFFAYDVEIKTGEVQDAFAKKDNSYYIQHSAKITVHNTGGPLLNEDGYVIGLNNVRMNEKGEEVYYSLPINEIKEILDNYDLDYGHMNKDQLWDQFEALVKECQELSQDESYKKKTRYTLNQVVTQIAPVLEEDSNKIEESQIEEYMQQLEEAKQGLEMKTRTTLKIIYVLAGVIAFLAILLIRLLVATRKGRTEKIDNKKTAKKSPEDKVKDSETDMKETVYLKEDQVKQVLSASKRKNASIVRMSNGQKVMITKNKFYLGKKEDNDFIIDENEAISRNHACISFEGGSYYLEDLGSANGTYVNGERLDKKEKVKLSGNEHLVFADEEFRFIE